MAFALRVHYDNADRFVDPHLHLWNPAVGAREFNSTSQDAHGVVFDVTVPWRDFGFVFNDGGGAASRWESPGRHRWYTSGLRGAETLEPAEIWCTAQNAFVYDVEPQPVERVSAAELLKGLIPRAGLFLPETGGLSGLGATVLADGRVLFGFYHPNAARVYLFGSFNGWQRPGHDQPDPARFLAMARYRGWFGALNTWLRVTDLAKPGDEYKFCVQGGVPRDHKHRFQQYAIDPYARRLAADFHFNNPVIVDLARFRWQDDGWVTPTPDRLILYELSVWGFTEGDPDIPEHLRGRFAGITQRIEAGYFERLGVTALSLMPLAEVPTPQGPGALGYDPSLFCSVERDFGTPDDLRQLVNTAHRHGLAVILDQVFNHTSSDFNPLWKMILEHPAEEPDSREGGLYFSGTTPWGNRVATEKLDVQHLLIDACKLFLTEYHVDGFRFDATHSTFMNHPFLEHLAGELTRLKPDVLLIAENLPNEADLNRQGFDGYAQWCDQFHDTLKALLREGPFDGHPNSRDHLGDIFYFSKQAFASHTNNVVNYSESHDETSIPFEVGTNPVLNHPAAKDRKGRLGLFAALVALGQPMLYMGQEFNLERDRNQVTVDWPADLWQHAFFQWVRRLIHLRRRYPGLRLYGYDPATAGQFAWILGPWLEPRRGGGRRVVGWRARPNAFAHDTLVVMLNFEGSPVQVDVDFGIPGVWVKLADLDGVNDIPPDATNSLQDPTAVRTENGHFGGFTLPSSSGFIYKWEGPA